MRPSNKSGKQDSFRHRKGHIVCSPSFCWGGGGLNLPPHFQEGGGLAGPQFLEVGCSERGVRLFLVRGKFVQEK